MFLFSCIKITIVSIYSYVKVTNLSVYSCIKVINVSNYRATYALRPVEFTYNANGKVTELKHLPYLEKRTYNSAGQLASITKGSRDNSHSLTTSYVYSDKATQVSRR